MSQMLGDAAPNNGWIEKSDPRLNPVMIELSVGLPPMTREFLWWPSSNFVGGFCGMDGAGIFQAPWFEPPEITRGHNMRYAVAGVTRDVYGTPLPSCTVKLYATASDERVDTTVSDAVTGAFTLYTPYYPDTHYLVAYDPGSPDVAGTSVNTIIAS